MKVTSLTVNLQAQQLNRNNITLPQNSYQPAQLGL